MNGFIIKLKYYGLFGLIKRFQEEINAACQTSVKIKKEDGVSRSRVSLVIDILYCTIRYGSDIYNYRSMKLYRLNHYGRNEFVTNLRNIKLIQLLDKGAISLFKNKASFNKEFHEFIHHKWIILPEKPQPNDIAQVKQFIEFYGEVIVKPVDSALGNGVHKLRNDAMKVDSLVEMAGQGQSFLIEQVVENHHEIKTLHPASVNTIRMVTCIDNNGVFHIVASLIRMGRGGAVIDNAKGDGIMCPIYPDNGIIYGDAYDLSGHRYKKHPDTGIVFVGLQIPRWNELLDYCEKLARHVPNARYVGWDIVVTENGFDVLEGNIPAGENITQMARGEGLWKEMLSYL